MRTDAQEKNRVGCRAYYYANRQSCLDRVKKYREANQEVIKQRKKEYQRKNKEAIKEKDKKYREENLDKIKEYQGEYYQKNKEKIKARVRERSQKNKEEIRAYQKEWSQKNRELIKTKRREYFMKNRQRFNLYYVEKAQTDIQFRIKSNLRKRIGVLIKQNEKVGSAVSDLGCTAEELRTYLESQFSDGMSWENWGRKGWHIDHIKPLASFDLTNRDEFLEACHYSNLQPLWWYDNLSKSNRV